jgi:hypothetical protein
MTPDGRLGLACQCRGPDIFVTVDAMDPEHLPELLHEFAVTCDNCGASHWVTPVAMDGGGG